MSSFFKRSGMELGVNNSGKVKSTHGGNEMYINAASTKSRSKPNQRIIPLQKMC